MTECTALPSLPHEVAELILLSAIRSIDSFDPRKRTLDSAAIHALLTALPGHSSTGADAAGSGGSYLTRAALLQMWWVDLDHASVRNNVPLLNTLLSMSHPRLVRPLQYSQGGLAEAVKLCHVDVAEWWYTQRQRKLLYFNDVEWKDVIVGFKQADTEADALRLFKWAIRALLDLDPDSLPASGLPAATFSIEPEYVYSTGYDGRSYARLSILTESMARGFYSTAQLALRVWYVAAEYRYSLALQSLAKNKDKDMVLWTLANLPRGADGRYYVLRGAVESGDQGFIRWAVGLHDEPPSKALLQSLPGASEAGQLDTIQWILTDPEMNTGLDAQGKLPYNTQVHMDKIALAGHLDVLEWWAANGDRLGASLVAHAHSSKCIVSALAKSGRMHVLKWWLEQKLFPVRPTTIKDLPVIAAEHGLVELLEYCKGTPALAKKVTYSTSALTAASTNGHLHVLEWWKANKKRITCGGETLTNATEHGQLAVLDWWFDKSGCKHLVYNEKVLAVALRYGQLDVFEWWLQRSVFDQDEIEHAFSSVEVMSEWNRFSYHPSIVLYLIRQGYFAPAPSDDDGDNLKSTNASNLVLSAMRQPVLLQFVHKHLAYTAEHTCRLLMQQILASAVQHGTVCTLQWMLAMLGSKPTDFPPASINHLKSILRKRDDSKATFRWLIDHEIPFDVAAVTTNGPGSPYQEIEEWLVEQVEKALELSMC